MRISNRVHLIASGHPGCSMTHPGDCNVYALRCGTAYLLIDSGVGIDPNSILAELRMDGIEPAQVEAILLTHGHLDHSGGAHCLREILNAPVFASPQTAAALETGDEEAISLPAARSAGIYDAGVRLHACPVQRVLSDREEFRSGDCLITAFHTPGHSHDMLSYLVKSPDGGLLFPGDTIFHGGRILLQDAWDCDLRAYTASLRILGQVKFDGLYPGHGLWSVHDGARHIRTSLSFVDRLLVPPNLITGDI